MNGQSADAAGAEARFAGVAPRLAVWRIAKSFGERRVLHAVSFELQAGEILGIVGDNGAGKTTLLKVLSGAVAPDAGSATLDGAVLPAGDPAATRARSVETVYQDFALAGNLDAAANIALGVEPRRRLLGAIRVVDDAATRRIAREVLLGLGLPDDLLRRPVRQLSEGQRQAIAIGRALARRPRLLLLDEPAAALGAMARCRLAEILLQLAARGGAVLVACHDGDDLAGLTTRLLRLRNGSLTGGEAATAVPSHG